MEELYGDANDLCFGLWACGQCHNDTMRSRAKIAVDPEEQAVAEVLDTVWEQRPPYVKKYQLEIGEDHTGDPAIWIHLKVAKDNKPSPQKVTELRKFADDLQHRILALRLRRWPYVHIAEVR
jgi:hypothetical protein